MGPALELLSRFLIEVGIESAYLLEKMSVYVLFGLLVAGALHTYVPSGWLVRNLSGGRFWPAVKASLLGIPLPLCSCGVLPAVISLRREGASRGAVIAFLVATPTTGVDSILATYALLGKVFAVFRVLASFLAGTVAGVVAGLVGSPETQESVRGEGKECGCSSCTVADQPRTRRFLGMLHYAFVELLGDIGKWLLIGILVGGLITALIPGHWIHQYLGSGWRAMGVMLVLGIPLYVCSTGSIPIAAALMMKGLTPGAAFVFLLVGPATNAVAITFVTRYLGKTTAAVYLGTLAVSAVALGYLLDWVWSTAGLAGAGHGAVGHELFPRALTVAASIVLVGLYGLTVWSKRRAGRERSDANGIHGSCCGHTTAE